jgi:hypothetical protein
LIDHAQQLAEAAFWKTGLVRKPCEILCGNVKNGSTLRRKVLRPKFAKGHMRTADLLKVVSHAFGKIAHVTAPLTVAQILRNHPLRGGGFV